MGHDGKRGWKTANRRPELALARGDRRSTGCAGKDGAGKNAGDCLLAAHGRKPFWAGSGTTYTRGNVCSAKRPRGYGKPSPGNASSRVVGECKLAASVSADHAGSL